MSVRPIVLLGDPRLRLKGKPVDSFGKYLHELLDDLAHTMRDAPGVGLAAPQLGEAMQACVIEVESQLYELVNPRIVRSTGDDRDLEGCLSIPGYVAYVTRRERVWVVAQDRQGKKVKVAGSGLLGRALQHELDHLDGKLYIDYLDSMDELMAVGAGNEDDAEVREGDERPRVTGGRAGGSRVRTVFLGSGGFGRESLWRLDGHDDVRLVGVVTSPPRPSGRRQRPSPSVIHGVAAELGVGPILTPERLRDKAAMDAVLALDPELLVLADYGQIVPAQLLGLAYGALNLHPSLLPRHRGSTPIPAAILAADPETGVTLMQMDIGLDTGPIIAQEHVALDGSETAPGLEASLEMVADGLLERSLGPWIRGEIKPRPQPETGATLTRPLRREDGRLDPRRTSADLERQVRAYQPWPGSFIDTPVGRIVVWSASAGSSGGPGVGRFDERGLGVHGGGRLWLIEVQPAGGKRMAWEAFVRGHPGIIGSAALASDRDA